MALPELENPPPHSGGSCCGVEEGPMANLGRAEPQAKRAPLIRLRIRRDFQGAHLLVKHKRVIDHFVDH